MDRQVYNTKNKLLATVDPTIGIWYMGVKSIIFQHFFYMYFEVLILNVGKGEFNKRPLKIFEQRNENQI